MVITIHSDVLFRHIIYRNARHWTWKLWSSLDDNNFWHGFMIEAHDISRRSKLKNDNAWEIEMVITFHSDVWFRHITQKLWTNSDDHNFWHGCTIEAPDKSRRSKLKKGSAWEIEMVITFHWDVQFRHIIYQDAWNWTRLPCPIQPAITFNMDVRLRPMIYRDVRNWKMEVLEKFKWS